MTSNMDWIDSREAEIEKEKADGYFKIVEGDNRVQLLTYTAPLAQYFDPGTKKYRIAEDGDKGVSIKGVCWILHDGKLKQAKLPYTVVKAIRAFQNDEETSFDEFPMPYAINIKAKNAGTKEVEYTVIPSRKESTIPAAILAELKSKPSPEEIIEKMRGKTEPSSKSGIEYPTDEINPEDVPF